MKKSVFVIFAIIIRNAYTQVVEPDEDFENNSECEAPRPQISHGRMRCKTNSCEAHCNKGYAFSNGETRLTVTCRNNQWITEEKEKVVVIECHPVCSPHCQNEGVCDSPNHCRCLGEFRGPQCQYNISNCISKLHFNGITECEDEESLYSCSLSCPPEMEFKVQPALKYTCLYSEGTFEPAPIPQCYPRSTSCVAFGDPHYKTFDGKRYDFMGRCSYYLVKMPALSIEAENVGCLGTILMPVDSPLFPSCTKSVTVKIYGETIKLEDHKVSINGQIIKELPHQVAEDVTIRTISSEYIQVDLPYDIRVTWNSNTIASIYVPVTLQRDIKEKIAGLCGTLNNNPDDDFTTPEGVIEKHVVSFASKWKIKDSCPDPPPQPHPCSINIEQKLKAESYCEVIKSYVFEKCHWKVDPESYYQDCLYDLCSCKVDYPNCLCPVVGAYADECAHNGIRLNWKQEVQACSTKCPPGQQYQICGNPCTRTCFDIAVRKNCQRQCVPGCNCPEGSALNEGGVCVPIEACQITTPEDCARIKNLVYTPCVQKELNICSKEQRENLTVEDCQPGCKCKDGYAWDPSINECVQKLECRCPEGESYQKDHCNTCRCQGGKWECTKNPCSRECSVWGESHYKTFDGKHYDLQGQCDYVLAQGVLGDDAFGVVVQSIPCGSLGTTCSKSVTIAVKSAGHEEKITLVRDQPLPKHATLKLLTIRQVGFYIIIEAENLGFSVRWDTGTRVYVRADSRWAHKTSGLCGNYNNNDFDDFQTPSTEIVSSIRIFGDSWKLNPTCPEPENITNSCQYKPHRKPWASQQCSVLKSSVFELCHDKVPVDIYWKNCIFDACACDEGDDCECLCTALAAYVQECNNVGVPIKWRWQKRCPIQCEEPYRYETCISTCPVETCDNFMYLSRLDRNCREETCVEGCAPKPCPPSHVYYNSSLTTCVPLKECTRNPCELEPFRIHSDCHKYYVCKNTVNGPRYVEETCGLNKYYNHETNRCDSKSIVELLRPECRELSSTVVTTDFTPTGSTELVPTCDLLHLYIKDSFDCTKYYICKNTENGVVYDEETCPENKYYNHITTKCEHKSVVELVRPECQRMTPVSPSVTPTPTQKTTPSPTSTEHNNCAHIKPIKCGYGEKIELIRYDEYNCPIYNCTCKDPDECEPLQDLKMPTEDGLILRIDNSGCCPKWIIICNPKLCLPTISCRHPYILKKETQKGKCCPAYSCEWPTDKCIYQNKYIAAENGEERLRTKEEKEITLITTGETWNDGPCRQCTCSIENHEVICTETRCPSSTLEIDYVLEKKFVYNQCCPEVRRIGCKHNGQEYRIGDTWYSEDNPCTVYKCIDDHGNVEKVTEITSCDTSCNAGFEYIPTVEKSGKCCGSCKQYACAFNGKIYRVGERWQSENQCINYACVEDNGAIQLQSQKVSCPEPPLDENYIYDTLEGNCCKIYKKTACKVDGKVYQPGETISFPDGNRCIKVTCARNEKNEIFIQEALEVCETTCPLGYEYNKTETECCGKCVQIGCIFNGEVIPPKGEWSSGDKCKTVTCIQDGGQFIVYNNSVSCRPLQNCPEENIYFDGCCEVCNYTGIDRGNCRPEEIKLDNTVNLVKVNHSLHGVCTNIQPIPNFTKCIGMCEKTFFNTKNGIYDTDCSCCHGVSYKHLEVNLRCTDGYEMLQQVSVPSTCACKKGCVMSHLFDKAHRHH